MKAKLDRFKVLTPTSLPHYLRKGLNLIAAGRRRRSGFVPLNGAYCRVGWKAANSIYCFKKRESLYTIEMLP